MKKAVSKLWRQALANSKVKKSTSILAISFVFYQCFLQQQAWAKLNLDMLYRQDEDEDEVKQANTALDSTNGIHNALSDTEIRQLIANMESNTVNTKSNNINNLTDLFTRDDRVANLFDNDEWLTNNDILQTAPNSFFKNDTAPDLQAITESLHTLLESNKKNDVENEATFIKTGGVDAAGPLSVGVGAGAGSESTSGEASAGIGAGTIMLTLASVAAVSIGVSAANESDTGDDNGSDTGDDNGSDTGDTVYIKDLTGDLLMLHARVEASKNLHVTSSGGIAQDGALSINGTSTFIATLDGKTITLDQANALTGAVTLTTNDSACNADVTLDNGTTALIMAASTVKGDIKLTSGATAGITDDGTITVCGDLIAITDANNGVINLGSLAVDGTIALTTNGSGNATAVNDAGLNYAASNVGGTLAGIATTGDLTQTGILTVGGVSTFTTSDSNADITLNSANAFADAVSLNTTGATGNAAVTDASGLQFTGSSVGGNLTGIATTGDITQNLFGAVLAVGGNSSFTTSNANDDITLNLANAFTGTVALNTNGATGHAEVTDASDLQFTGSTVGGNLTGTATTGDITQNGVLTVGGVSTFTTSNANDDITLDLANAFTGEVSLNTNGTGDATVKDANTLALAASTVGGDLKGTAVLANITQSGVLTVGGVSTFTTSATNADITLNQANVFSDAVILKAGTGTTTFNDITFRDNGAIKIENSTANADANGDLFLDAATDNAVGGNLSLTATTGNITQAAALTVTGTSAFITDDTNADITLNSANAFGTSVAFFTYGVTGHAEVTDASGLALAASHVGGDLTGIATTGNLTQTGILTVGGVSTFTTSDTNADITLNSANAFRDAVSLNTNGATGHAEVTDTNGLALAVSNVGGNLTGIATTNVITQTGILTVGGVSSFTTSDSNADITLTQANAFTGAVSLNTSGGTGNADITDASDLALGTSTVGGSLTGTATTGDITQTGVLTVGGPSAFTTSENDATITLDFNNDFGVFVAFNTAGTAGHVIVNDADGLALQTSTVNGNFTSTAVSGDINQIGGPLTVTGASAFNTVANNASITLDQANPFTGAVTLKAGDGTAAFNNITFRDTAAIKIDSNADANDDLFLDTTGSDNAVGGNLVLTAGSGNITQAAALTVGGDSTFTTSDSNFAITLNSANVFTGTVALNTIGGGIAHVKDTDNLTLAASNVGSSLIGTATTGDITQTGVLDVGGTSTFTTQATGSDITLNQANDFGGAVILKADDAGNEAFGDITFIDNGAIKIENSEGNTNTNDDLFLDTTGSDNAVGGNLVLTAGSGNITQAGALTVTGTSTFTTSAANATITLDTTTNALSGNVILTTNDSSGTDADATIDNGTTILNVQGTVDGDLNLTAGNTITDSAALTVAGTTTVTTDENNKAITLDNLASTGNVIVTTQGTTGHVTIDNGTTALNVQGTVDGNLNLTAGNTITDSAALTVAGTTTVTTDENNKAITLDNLASTGNVIVTTQGTTGHVTIDNGTTILNVQGAVDGDLSLRSGDKIQDSNIMAVAGNLTVHVDVDNPDVVMQTLQVNGSMDFTTGTNGYVLIINDTGINFAASNIGGYINATATTGNITQTGALTVTSHSVFTTKVAGSNIILDQANNFGTYVILKTDATGTAAFGDITFRDNGPIKIESSAMLAKWDGDLFLESADSILTVGGNLSLTAGSGNITQAAALTVTGNSAFTTLGNNDDITLTQANAFTGAVSLNTTGGSGNASVVDANGLSFAASSVGGTLAGTATLGNITQTGALTVGSTSTFTTTANNADITLAHADNAFANAVTLKAGDGTAAFTDVSFRDTGGINIDNNVDAAGDLYINAGTDSAVGGTLSLTATTGDITQGQLLTVGGASAFTTLGTHDDIALNSANAFASTVALNTTGATGNASVVDANGLSFAASSVGGTLAGTATLGDIIQTGALTVGSTSVFTTKDTGSAIILDQANVFGGGVVLKADTAGNENFNHITFRDSGAIKIENSAANATDDGDLFLDATTNNAVGGHLILTAGSGHITQVAALTVGGDSAFTTSNANDEIVLQGANNFSGSVYLTTSGSAGNALITDAANLSFGVLSLGGSLTGTATTGSIIAGTIGLQSGETLVLLSTDGTQTDRDYTITTLDIDNGAINHKIGDDGASNFAGDVSITNLTQGGLANTTLSIWHGESEADDDTPVDITIGGNNTVNTIVAAMGGNFAIDNSTNDDVWVITF